MGFEVWRDINVGILEMGRIGARYLTQWFVLMWKRTHKPWEPAVQVGSLTPGMAQPQGCSWGTGWVKCRVFPREVVCLLQRRFLLAPRTNPNRFAVLSCHSGKTEILQRKTSGETKEIPASCKQRGDWDLGTWEGLDPFQLGLISPGWHCSWAVLCSDLPYLLVTWPPVGEWATAASPSSLSNRQWCHGPRLCLMAP